MKYRYTAKEGKEKKKKSKIIATKNFSKKHLYENTLLCPLPVITEILGKKGRKILFLLVLLKQFIENTLDKRCNTFSFD